MSENASRSASENGSESAASFAAKRAVIPRPPRSSLGGGRETSTRRLAPPELSYRRIVTSLSARVARLSSPFAFALVLLAFASHAACTGEDATLVSIGSDGSTSTPPTTTSDTTENDSSTPPTSTGDTDAATDAAITCDAPTIACDGKCADIAWSKDHCGACGHSCGGGDCVQGVCKPFELYSGTAQVTSVSVDSTDVYFALNDSSGTYKLLACTKDGCKLAPRQVAAMSYGIRNVVALPNGTVVFQSAPNGTTERPAIYFCAKAGCAAPLSMVVQDGLSGFNSVQASGNDLFITSGGLGAMWSSCAANGSNCPINKFGTETKPASGASGDSNYVYFLHGSSSTALSIARCARSSATCGAPEVVVDLATAQDVPTTVVHGGKLYWLKQGRDGYAEGRLKSCDPSGACSGKDLATGLNSPLSLLVDDSGSYFVDAELKLLRCAPDDCVGGAREMLPATPALHSVVTDDKFVYYATATSVFRIAK